MQRSRHSGTGRRGVEGRGGLWKREDGKAVIVAVALGGEHYYVAAAHCPSAENADRERAEFETDMRSEYLRRSEPYTKRCIPRGRGRACSEAQAGT